MERRLASPGFDWSAYAPSLGQATARPAVRAALDDLSQSLRDDADALAELATVLAHLTALAERRCTARDFDAAVTGRDLARALFVAGPEHAEYGALLTQIERRQAARGWYWQRGRGWYEAAAARRVWNGTRDDMDSEEEPF